MTFCCSCSICVSTALSAACVCHSQYKRATPLASSCRVCACSASRAFTTPILALTSARFLPQRSRSQPAVKPNVPLVYHGPVVPAAGSVMANGPINPSADIFWRSTSAEKSSPGPSCASTAFACASASCIRCSATCISGECCNALSIKASSWGSWYAFHHWLSGQPFFIAVGNGESTCEAGVCRVSDWRVSCIGAQPASSVKRDRHTVVARRESRFMETFW